LYIHIPFCAACCGYCDFYSVPLGPDTPLSAFIDAILGAAEKELHRFAVERVPTVYIGGGTPSVLGASGIARLLRGLRSLWAEDPEEITVEVNPESATEEFLTAAREGGVTRVSIGVQSFHAASRGAVHRAGDLRLLPERLRLVRDLFPGAFSADLMAGLPFQDQGVLLGDIEGLLSYEPAQVSLYALTVEEGTPLAEQARRNLLPPAEEADRLWIAGRDALEQAGFRQYEVSNFARPGGRSLHNIRYWRMENWLGIGPAASGTLIDEDEGTGRRYTWPADAGAWLAGGPPPAPLEEPLDRLTLMKESLLMGFRYTEGPDAGLFFRRFGRTVARAIPRTIAAWEGRGFFSGPLKPSPQGLLMLNPFLLDAFEELQRRPE
jgi:oxygen-independent coproporphyrinogen-3 oxidase